jgi:hypothetical protein
MENPWQIPETVEGFNGKSLPQLNRQEMICAEEGVAGADKP